MSSALKFELKALKAAGASKSDIKAAKRAYKAAQRVEAAAALKAAWKALKAAGAPKPAIKAAKIAYKAAKEAASEAPAASSAKRSRAAPPADAPDAKKPRATAEPTPEVFTGPEFATFAASPFDPSVLALFTRAGFTAPTAIQARSWPLIMDGKDLIAVAKTGSGKTLAFLLPAFHRLRASLATPPRVNTTPTPSALIIAPTRELAMQIDAESRKFAPNARCSLLYGGVPVHAQLSAMRKRDPHMIVATPGRLCDALERGALTLGSTTYVVLDEADRMLDMGFEPQIKVIFDALPAAEKRQTIFFSATWPKEIRAMAATFLRASETKELFVGGSGPDAELSANKAVSQRFIYATDDEKEKKLYDELALIVEAADAAAALPDAPPAHSRRGGPTGYRIICFANTKNRVDKLTRRFWDWGCVYTHEHYFSYFPTTSPYKS